MVWHVIRTDGSLLGKVGLLMGNDERSAEMLDDGLRSSRLDPDETCDGKPSTTDQNELTSHLRRTKEKEDGEENEFA